MLTGKYPPPPPFGTKVGTRQAEVLDTLGKLTRIQGGRGAMWSPAGLFLDQVGTSIRLGVVGTGGIDKRVGTTLGHGDVTDAYLTSSSPTAAAFNNSSSTFTAFNLSTNQTVTSGSTVICMILWGLWIVVWADCTS